MPAREVFCFWQYLKEEHPSRKEIKEGLIGNWLYLDFPNAHSAMKLNCPIGFALIADITKEGWLLIKQKNKTWFYFLYTWGLLYAFS